MGTVSALAGHRLAGPGRSGPRAPALRVTLGTGDPAADAALGVVSLVAEVTGGRTPVRLYLYVNGDLVETWTDSTGHYDLSLDEHGPGRHAVTVRAVDARGRWAGASMIVACAAVGLAGNE
jgi:hypothetical protein